MGFLKLVRLLREEETMNAREVLSHCEVVANTHLPSDSPLRQAQKNVLPEAALKSMLIKLGYSPPPNIISQAMKVSGDTNDDGSVDVQGVLGILAYIREQQVTKLRASAGISDQQASKIRGKFNMRIENGKVIEPNEFEKVMYELFPTAHLSQTEREKVKALIKQHSKEKGITTLMDAFWIVRLYGDMRDEEKWRREQEAAEKAGFSNWQVSSFREAFTAADVNGDGSLSSREIQLVFEDLMSLNLGQVEAMRKEFHQLGDKSDCIEFCDFLKLMFKILKKAGMSSDCIGCSSRERGLAWSRISS